MNDYNGLLVMPGDRAALSHALANLVIDAEKRRRFGLFAYQDVNEKFSMIRMIDSYKNIFEQV
jgi:glycosyltransferase involved in cell wall biosynthesis